MSNSPWETVDVPRGAYISWGPQPGQSVTGKVLDYSPAGGTDFAGQPCPQLSLELLEPTFSVNKDGVRTEFPARELVVLNCGLVSLKRAVKAAALEPGMLAKITFASTVKTSNGTVKEFEIQRAKGAAPAASQGFAPAGTVNDSYLPGQAQPASSGWGASSAAEPPF